MKPTLEQIQAMKARWFYEKYKTPDVKTISGIPIEHVEYALTLAEQVALGEVVVVPKVSIPAAWGGDEIIRDKVAKEYSRRHDQYDYDGNGLWWDIMTPKSKQKARHEAGKYLQIISQLELNASQPQQEASE